MLFDQSGNNMYNPSGLPGEGCYYERNMNDANSRQTECDAIVVEIQLRHRSQYTVIIDKSKISAGKRLVDCYDDLVAKFSTIGLKENIRLTEYGCYDIFNSEYIVHCRIAVYDKK